MTFETIFQPREAVTYQGNGWQTLPFPIGRTPSNYDEFEYVVAANFDDVSMSIPPTTVRFAAANLINQGAAGLSLPQFNLAIRQNKAAFRLLDGVMAFAIIDDNGVPLTTRDDAFQVIEIYGRYIGTTSPDADENAALIEARAKYAKAKEILGARLSGDADLIEMAVGGDVNYKTMNLNDLQKFVYQCAAELSALDQGGISVFKVRDYGDY